MSSTVGPGGNAPKSMSSRLLTMKFMQRAAAPPVVQAPSSAIERSPKRRKKESDSTSLRQNDNSFADHNYMLLALAEEKKKSLAALDKLAAESGDTRWVLNYKDQECPASATSLRVVYTGYAGVDGSSSLNVAINEYEEKPTMIGRRSFGEFNKVLERQQNLRDEETLGSGSEGDENAHKNSSESEISASDENDPTSQLIKNTRRELGTKSRVEIKAKNNDTNGDVGQRSKKRRQTEVSLNHLTSLSGRQEISPRAQIECYLCGGPHRKVDCSKNKRGQKHIDDGPPRKSFKLS
ncbi:putative zinc knuckle protein [Golovinomyces cichoracearum]|uniref:Putative zinc knuckle protein n=1 Tax=Golovinomyces cichoracearum TaxID=62708 RepID=A0A420H9X5_9PEZI|nr:putative zinc knuckle protein [Golovinomyces cichoracearum]